MNDSKINISYTFLRLYIFFSVNVCISKFRWPIYTDSSRSEDSSETEPFVKRFFFFLSFYMFLYICICIYWTIVPFYDCTMAVTSCAILPWLLATCGVLWHGTLNCGKNLKRERTGAWKAREES